MQLCATDDKNLPYVTELLPPELRKMELFPVGRLDRDTVGLMILTNNGPLSHAVLSPRRHVEKLYRFSAAEPLSPDAEARFENGMTLADGYECKSARLEADPDRMGGVISLTEGKYHQIKRMFESVNNKITYMKRVTFGPLTLDGVPERGDWRYLTENEIKALEEHGKNEI